MWSRPRETPLSTFPTPLWGGEARAGQRTEDGGPGCPHSMLPVCTLPSNKWSSLIFLGTFVAQGQGLGWARHNATSSCTPPFLEVPQVLDSFPK